MRALQQMVGGGNNFVVEAGTRILNAGGNAVDAGVAATPAAAVTEEDHFSMGGEMLLLVKMNWAAGAGGRGRRHRADAGGWGGPATWRCIFGIEILVSALNSLFIAQSSRTDKL